MPVLNHCEQFFYNRTHDFAHASRDPLRYTDQVNGFLHQLAAAAATLVGETASPLEVVNFTNIFYTKLAQMHHGVPQEVRLSPQIAPPAPMPAPDEIPDYVDALRAAAPVARPPAPPARPLTENLVLALEPAAKPAPKRRRIYVGKAPRGAAVGPQYLSGDQIRHAREALGLSQDALGEDEKLSGGFICELENGVAMGKRGHYVKLRRALNMVLPGEEE